MTNTEVLIKLKDVIRAEADAFAMEAFYSSDKILVEHYMPEPEKNMCGTTTCLGGSLVAMHDQISLESLAVKAGVLIDSLEHRQLIEERANKIVGVVEPVDDDD